MDLFLVIPMTTCEEDGEGNVEYNRDPDIGRKHS